MKWQLNTIMPKQFFFASGNAKETKETVEYTSGNLDHTGNVQTGNDTKLCGEDLQNFTMFAWYHCLRSQHTCT